jgi:hypothetical protein
MTLVGTATPAAAAGWTASGESYWTPNPYDAGGYDAWSRLSGDGNWMTARFHAYDEVLHVFNNTGSDAFVDVWYQSASSGTVYEWSYQPGRASDWSVQLGGTGNLAENGTIKVRISTLLTNGNWYTGRT